MNLENEIIDYKDEINLLKKTGRKVACFSKETETELTGE